MTDLRKAAEMALEALETLWDILDDIDTASDMAKENDAWYRKRVEALQKKRWDTMITTDGYKLKDGPVEALRQALTQPEPISYVPGFYRGEKISLSRVKLGERFVLVRTGEIYSKVNHGYWCESEQRPARLHLNCQVQVIKEKNSV
jgi:hypothetical protein